MKEAIQILHEFGIMGIWGIIIFQVLDLVKILCVFGLIGYGIKKAWPSIQKLFDI